MKLRLVSENVEKLLPHLKADVLRYFAARKAESLPIPIERGYRESDDDVAKKAVEWALRCDPMYLKGKASNKPLEHIKSPFVKHVLRWWLDPKAGGGLELPEDIETTGELLKLYSNAKQRGLNTELSSIGSWEQFNQIMAPFAKAEGEGNADRYNRMGFRTIFEDGPWKVYLIDKWLPGEPSTLYPDQLQHKALEGTKWCVKYENTFKHYQPSVYGLVLLNGRRFALMHLQSLQFKNTLDRPVFSTDKEAGLDFLQRFFSAKRKLYAEVFTKSVIASHGDYAGFIPLLNLPTPDINELRQAAEKQGASAVAKVAKFTKTWPDFSDWPTGMKIILDSAKSGNPIQQHFALYELIKATGRIPALEELLVEYGNVAAATKYVELALETTRSTSETIQSLGALMNATLISAVRQGIDAAKAIRAGVPSVRRLQKLGAGALDSDELEQAVLRSQEPTAVFAYAQLLGQRWPAGEPLLAYSKSMAQKYCTMFGLKLKDLVPDESENSAEKEVRKAIANAEESQNEDLILTDLSAALLYAQHVVGPWPELEQRLDEEGTAEQQERYRRNVLQL